MLFSSHQQRSHWLRRNRFSKCLYQSGIQEYVSYNEKADPLFVYYLLKYNKDAIEAMGSGTTFYMEVSGKYDEGC